MRFAWSLCAVLFSLSIAAAQPRINGVVNGASFQPLVAPGSFATAAVQDLAVPATTASSATLPYTLAGVSVTVNNQPAPLYYVSATQINFQVPRNTPAGPANLVLRFNNVNSAPFQFQVAAAAPGILLYGANQAVAQHPDGQLITPANPIFTGGVAVLYLTGIGPVDNPANDATPTPFPPLATATSAASATIGGAAAQILFLGLTPGFAGLAQANILIPDLPPGDYPVILTVGGRASATNGPILSVTRGPHLTLTSGNLTIDPDSTDSYTFQGDFRGLSLDNAQTIAFEVGQFAAQIPIDRFTKQQGSNVLTYQDTTGLNPYWLSNLTINPDTRTFTATANGIALSGLPNPFPLRFGANDAAGCTMARVQRTGNTTWALTRETAPETPCLIDHTVIRRAYAGTRTNITFQARIYPTLGLDPNSVRLYHVNESAQPIGAPLCTLAAQPGGIYSCNLVVEQAQIATIPLLVQATAGSRTLLSNGFPLLILRSATPADEQQLAAVDEGMAAAEEFFTQFGETPHARSLAVAALRKLFPNRPLMTGAQAGLSLDGASIDVRTDSGMRITKLRNRLVDSSGATAQLPAAKPVPVPRHADSFRVAAPTWARTATAESLRCGDFQRDVITNTNVLVWSTDELFFNEAPEPFAKHLEASKCPDFNVRYIRGVNATPQSLEEFSKYGTVIISSHGGKGYGDGELLTASQDRNLLKIDPDGYAENEVKYFAAGPGGVPVERKGKFISVLPGNSHLRKIDNALVFGAFCYSNLMDRTFRGEDSAYYGYRSETTNDAAWLVTDRLFNGLVNEYKSTSEINVFYTLHGNGNLSYTGNPKLTVPGIEGPGPYPANPNSPVKLKAELEGTDKCDGIMQLHWKTPGQAGTLRPAKNGSGTNDYTVADVEANYTAFGPGSGSSSDNIMVDFQPNSDSGSEFAGRACAVVSTGRKEVIVETTGVFNYSDEGPHDLSEPNAKVTTGMPFETSDSRLGGSNKLRVEQTGANTWKVTQEFAAPTRDDIFTDTWNRVDLRLVNAPGPRQIKVHVDVNVTGSCQGYQATFVGNAGPVDRLDEGNNGCKDSWDFQGFSQQGNNGSALLVLKLSAAGAKSATFGPGKGSITTTIELLDSSDPIFPE